MNDFASPSDRLLDQLPERELERARQSVFKALIQAHRRRDLQRIEDQALRLSALARYLRLRGERGQVLVELAIVLPVLVMLFLGSISSCDKKL
jgi:hypothetical protein